MYVREVVKNRFRLKLFVRIWLGVPPFEVRSPDIS
jgi:hypothetical protein